MGLHEHKPNCILVKKMFIEYGYNIQNPIPVKKLLEQLVVTKAEKSNTSRTVNPKRFYEDDSEKGADSRFSKAKKDAYQAIEQIEQDSPVLHARQIMSSPVSCLNTDMSISDALILFRKQTYRHMPVLTSEKKLTGMVSDRDVLHFTSRLSEADRYITAPVTELMKSPVLTASIETDVRYIAKLFVLEHIGAMPVMSDGQMTGIITRTDVMRAVMQHFNLELWV